MKKIVLFTLLTLCLTGCGCSQQSSSNSSINEVQKETYLINIKDSENGVVTADKEVVSGGQFVTFTIKPNDGYVLETFIVNNQTVNVTNNKYTVFDVREDLTCEATFKNDKIKIRYFDDTGENILYQKQSDQLPCEVPFKGDIPSKAIKDGYYYTFTGWYTEKESGVKVENFNFTTSTDLYARFESHQYTLQLSNSLELDVFKKSSLGLETNLPQSFDISYSSSNKNVAIVSSEGIVTALSAGQADINVNIGLDQYKCSVTVKDVDAPLKAKYVYGNGYVNYEGGVGTIYSSQATIVNSSNQIIEYNYVDYSLDMYLENAATGNFGLAFHKTVDSTSMTTSSYQFNYEIGSSNNIKLLRDGVIVGSTKSYPLFLGSAYNFRVVTSPSDNYKIKVECYINNEKVIDEICAAPNGNGKQCGIRMASAVTNRFANIKLTDNTPEVSQDSYDGTLSLNYSTYSLNALETFTLSPIASKEHSLQYVWASSDNTIAIVIGGVVTAVGNGTCDITVSLGDVSATCKVTVNVDENYTFKSVYGSTSNSTVTNGVYTFGKNGVQADIFDTKTNAVAKLTSYDIEMNLYIGCNIGSGAKFGFQINKTEKSETDKNINNGYAFKPLTGTTNNVSINEESSSTSSTSKVTGNASLTAGNTYRIKISVTTTSNSVSIKGYIDGVLICEYTDQENPYLGTIFGLRCAALTDSNSPHKIAIVSVTNNN